MVRAPGQATITSAADDHSVLPKALQYEVDDCESVDAVIG